MELTKEVLEGINRKMGGSVRFDAAVEHALEAGEGKHPYRRIALLWRAVLVGHPYTDGNKRTALAATLLVLRDAGKEPDQQAADALAQEMLIVARGNLEDLPELERRVRYAIERR